MKIFKIDEEYKLLIETLIRVASGKRFNQVALVAGGGGSGKGFSIKNKTNLDGYKSFNVDDLKDTVLKFETFFNKYPELKRINNTGGLKNPENVQKLHKFVQKEGIEKRFIFNRISKMIMSADPKRKPNLLFDKTARSFSDFVKIFGFTNNLGYIPENNHIIWVFTNFDVAKKRNLKRSRVVPEKILLQTHEGVGYNMADILIKGKSLSKDIFNGEFYIINGSGKETFYPGSDILKNFEYIKIKEAGKGIEFKRNDKKKLMGWFLLNLPKTDDMEKIRNMVYDKYPDLRGM